MKLHLGMFAAAASLLLVFTNPAAAQRQSAAPIPTAPHVVAPPAVPHAAPAPAPAPAPPQAAIHIAGQTAPPKAPSPTIQASAPPPAASRWATTGSDLQHATVEGVVANAQHGVMGSSIVTVRLPSGVSARMVFKPVNGERDWGSYKKGTLYVREIAASKLSDALGFDLVPPTVEITINGEKGSGQLFVEGAPVANAVRDQSRMDPGRREVMTVFDYLIANGDRHGGNWLVRDTNGKQEPIAIDHGLAFPSQAAAGRAPPAVAAPETRAVIARTNSADLARTLRDTGLDEPAVTGFVSRFDALKKSLPPAP